MEQSKSWLDVATGAIGVLGAGFVALKEIRAKRFSNGHNRRKNDSEFQQAIFERLDKMNDGISSIDRRTVQLETHMGHVLEDIRDVRDRNR